MTYETKSRYFQYRDGQLFVENVNLCAVAEQFGTPTYVYSNQAILDAFHGYKQGLIPIPHLIAFAVKANGNLTILNRLARAGAGADLTSGGELALALKAGIQPDKMVFSGVGKTDREIRDALQAGIMMFNIESEPELETLARIAASMNKIAPVAIRVNPNVDAKTHPKISTGLKEHKFGIPLEQAKSIYEKAAALHSVKIKGVAAHIGSSLFDTTPLLDALDVLLAFRDSLQRQGIEIPYLDMGGGLGIQYEDVIPESPNEYAEKVKEKVLHAGVTLILEPGRSIVGNAGILLCKVSYVKKSVDKTFVIVDAGMNSLARPAIYGAYHHIIPASIRSGEVETVDIVGPICESSDVFGKHRKLPACQPGDCLVICSAGAYGFSMASNYNGQLKPAEVYVENDMPMLVRERETYEDLFRYQTIV